MNPAAVVLARLLAGVGAFLLAFLLSGAAARFLPWRRGRARARLALAVLPFVVLVVATLRGPSAEPRSASEPRGTVRIGAGLTPLGPFVHAAATAPRRFASEAPGTGAIVASALDARFGPRAPWALVAVLVGVSASSVVRRLRAVARARRVVAHACSVATSAWPLAASPSVGVVVTPALVGSPFVEGPRASRVIVPASSWGALSEGERDAVLLHELAHLRGRHPWLLFGAAAVAGAFAFVPFVSRAERALRSALEDCADEAAVAAGACPLSLASALVRIAELGGAAPGVRATSLGAASRGFEARVEALLDPAAPASKLHELARWVLVALVALVALRSVVFP